MSNYTSGNLINVSASEVPAGTLAMKVGNDIFLAGGVNVISTYNVTSVYNITSNFIEQIGDAYVVVDDNGTLKAQKLAFDSAMASDSGEPETLENVMIFNTGHDEPQYEGSGGTAMDFYKCVSVDTSNSTWSGYRFDPVNLQFESVTSTDLVYTSMIPVVGGIYDTACLYRVSEIGGYVAQQLLFFPFTTDTNTVVGSTATLVSGTYTQDIIQGIYCLNCNSVDIRVAVSLQMPLSVCFWGKLTTGAVTINMGGVGDTTGKFCFNVTSSSIETFKHNQKMYIKHSVDNTSGLAFYCVTLQSTGNMIWKNGVQLDIYSGDYGSFPSNIIGIQVTGYITNLRVFTKVLTGNEITTLYNKLHPVIS